MTHAAKTNSALPSSDLQEALRLARLLWARACRSDLTRWCQAALLPAQQAPARHHRLLLAALGDVAAGRCDRLLVAMPPGAAKSTYASRLFPAWYLAQPDSWSANIIAVSHTDKMAETHSRGTLRYVRAHAALLGYGLVRDSVGEWETTRGGLYTAMGIGSGITGRRANLILIDDPLRGRADADSAGVREGLYEWYRADLLTRLVPGGAVVLIQTRWHEDDLAGRLLQDAAAGGDPWRTLSLPALAEAADPLGRQPGEPLWPERQDRAALDRLRAAVGEREWSALYQQDPRPREGGLFKPDRCKLVLDPDPAWRIAVTARGWDLAASEQTGARDPDYTVGLKLARLADGRLLVLDVVRLRAEAGEVLARILATAREDGPGVLIGLPQDPGQAGKWQATHFASALMGYRITASPESGAKLTRAEPIASQANLGNLMLLDRQWTKALLEELRGFPAARHDDQVDALARAFSLLVSAARPMRRESFVTQR